MSARLPAGPRAPAAWQTAAWMSRPAAFLAAAHRRYGDPFTIRTYWTREPMVIFSSAQAISEIFALDPLVAPAGESWEFLRPFAGPDSILLLDGEEHLVQRRTLAAPFHGARLQGLASAVAELARAELAGWRGRVVTLERMRALTLEIVISAIFGARGGDRRTAELRAAIEQTLASVRSLPRMLSMALVQRDLGDWSPWGRFRLAVERFDALLYEVIARASPREDSVLGMLLEQQHSDPRMLRDQLVALLVGGHDSSAAALAWGFERLARHPDVQERLRDSDSDSEYAGAVVREVLRSRPPLTIAPRLLRRPATIAGVPLPAGIQLTAGLWPAMRRADLWEQAGAFRPDRWLSSPRPDPRLWVPFGGGVRRCAGARFAELELREVLRTAVSLHSFGPVRPRSEQARRSMLVVVPERGGEVLVSPRPRAPVGSTGTSDLTAAARRAPDRGCSSRCHRG